MLLQKGIACLIPAKQVMDGKMEGRMSSWHDEIHEVNHRCFITNVAEGLRGCATQETAGLGG